MLDTNPKRHYILDCILWHCNFICSILNQWLCAQYSSGVRGLFLGANMLIKAGLDSITSDSWWQSDVHDGSNDGSLGSCLWSQVMRADQWSWGQVNPWGPEMSNRLWIIIRICLIQIGRQVMFTGDFFVTSQWSHNFKWQLQLSSQSIPDVVNPQRSAYLLFKRFMQIYLQQW